MTPDDEQLAFPITQRVEYAETREERAFRRANDPARLARRTDVETSHAAIPRASRRASQKAAIITLYNNDPRGLTADEVCAILGDGLWRRVSELRDDGLLAWKLDADDRPVTRTCRSGRQGRVLVRVLDAL